ncbi:MAG TPA: alpha/beta hydrolase [Ktedonobacteraceae bacterium]|nr:alpha/beta hydrolase [Ktedonobacteraceae bacterium]
MLTKPIHDEYIVAGDLTFHYVQWGEKGKPLICVHGITANAYCFQALADGLANDHQVFAYDLRGRGDSDKPESGYSISIHAADLAAIIDELGLDHPVIIGHSLGAFIALYFAAHYPGKLSKLVLIDAGAPLPWNTVEEQPAWLTASIARLGVPVASFDEFTQRLKVAPFLGPYWNDYIETYFEHDVYRHSDGSVVSKGSRQAILEEQRNQQQFKPEEQWAKVKVPTLLLRAGLGLFTESDQLLPEASAAAIQRGIKNCKYVNFPKLNHYTIIFGVSGGPARAIREFVDGDKEQ